MRELRHICGAKKTLPTSSALSSQVLLISNQPVASGGSGDVYEGTLNNSRVCVKRIRVYAKDSSGEPPDVRHIRYHSRCLLLLTRPTDVLQRGRGVEAVETQEHRPPHLYLRGPFPAHFRMDARRRPDGIRREASRRRPAWSRERPSLGA